MSIPVLHRTESESATHIGVVCERPSRWRPTCDRPAITRIPPVGQFAAQGETSALGLGEHDRGEPAIMLPAMIATALTVASVVVVNAATVLGVTSEATVPMAVVVAMDRRGDGRLRCGGRRHRRHHAGRTGGAAAGCTPDRYQ